MAELVHGEKEHSDWSPERSVFLQYRDIREIIVSRKFYVLSCIRGSVNIHPYSSPLVLHHTSELQAQKKLFSFYK